MLYRNRPVNNRGFSHGGVGVFYREGAASLSKVKMHNPDNYEVLMTVGTLKGLSRKIVVVGCYIPPNYSMARGHGALDYISDCITQAK